MGSTVNFKALYWAAEAHKPFCNDITKAIDVTNETEWGSQKTDLFTSDSKGKVTGHKTGSGSLRGEYNGMVDLAMVHVVEELPLVTLVGEAVKVRVGAGVVFETVTVTLFITDPPSPVHLRV